MNKKIIALIIIAVIIFGIVALRGQRQPAAGDPARTGLQQQAAEEQGAGFKTLTGAELAEMLKQKDFFFVNVHTPYAGEIEKTDAFIPYDKIGENLDKLPKDKNAKIVLYCRSGRMSEIAARELIKQGYVNVSHLAGGMVDWETRGYEIIKK